MLEKEWNTFLHTHHNNPLYRIVPKAFVEENGDFNYDKEKYRDMLLEAAETVLGYFGFDRTAFGDAPKKNKIKNGGSDSMKRG